MLAVVLRNLTTNCYRRACHVIPSERCNLVSPLPCKDQQGDNITIWLWGAVCLSKRFDQLGGGKRVSRFGRPLCGRFERCKGRCFDKPMSGAP